MKYIGIFISFAFISCGFFNDKEKSIVLARAHGQELLYDEIKDIIPANSSSRDSLDIINRFVKSWVQKQLLLEKAEKELNYNEAEVERKLMDYKYALIVYEYQKKYLSENLDTTITQNEIETYYNENKDNFQLKQNIIKGIYVKIPKRDSKKARIKSLIREEDKDYKEIRSLCYRFATDYVLGDTTWNNFDEIISNSPFNNIPDKVQFLKTTKFAELSDSAHTYYLSIEDYKIEDQNSPLEFVRSQVSSILLNRRRIALIKKLENEIYNKALNNKEVEVFTKDN